MPGIRKMMIPSISGRSGINGLLNSGILYFISKADSKVIAVKKAGIREIYSGKGEILPLGKKTNVS